MKQLLFCLFGFCLLICWSAVAAEKKTDLKRDVYVESTTTDFKLTVTNIASNTEKILTFQVSAPNAGKYTLLSFVDGKVWSQKECDLPYEFKLNVSGLVKGMHRLTLQAVDGSGRVGMTTHKLKIE